jgi:hypothetical protein
MSSLNTSRSLAAIVLLGLATGVAQETSSGVVRWKYGAPNAVTDTTHAAKVEGLKTDDVHIYVALYDVKDTEYNRAWVQIVNHGKTPIEFNPQSALLKDGTTVRAEAPEKAANSVQRVGEARSQELAAPKCDMMNGGGGSGAPAVSATLACRPTDMQVELSKEVLTVSNEWAGFIRARALKPTTVAPGEQVIGTILFRKGKKPANYTLAIPVGAETFEFPVSALNTPPSFY